MLSGQKETAAQGVRALGSGGRNEEAGWQLRSEEYARATPGSRAVAIERNGSVVALVANAAEARAYLLTGGAHA